MDWPKKMTAALDYIEDHLDGEMEIGVASQIACCSRFHFQRLFLIVSGMTVGEYVRRRRLTLAARDLSSGDTKVIDVSLKYGYDSPDAFTRAFRIMHGVTPQAARAPGAPLVACPRISFHIVLKGGTDMDYRIVEKPSFPIALTTRSFTTVNEQNFIEIPKWWQEFLASPDCAAMTGLTGNKTGATTGSTMLGLCWGETDDIEFSYSIGVELPEGATSGPFEKKEIPAQTWAVFNCTLNDLQDVTKRIFSEWFPSTGYEHAAAPELEVYLPETPGKPMRCELWMPVVNNKS